ncbi:MAG: NusA N-terminal domain-containing protein, partial [Actinomycetota bacterium]
MDIDVNALKALVREKELSWDLVIDSIEQALLVAYQRTEGAAEQARVEVDRKTGHVTVWAREIPEEADQVAGTAPPLPREYDDTPSGFGR